MNGKTNVKAKLFLVNLMIFIGFYCFFLRHVFGVTPWVAVIMAVLPVRGGGRGNYQ
ncbi:hypothetical protein LZ645_03360 [Shewanella algae]|uniref:hypothetical protein n=1 Tax=Shewanella algae TaxID=38313 RepID=UPI001F27E005|nr:hypothetical protein [Shewanella algae]MCE9773986.1 hypothetical protein [Shewanella algae]